MNSAVPGAEEALSGGSENGGGFMRLLNTVQEILSSRFAFRPQADVSEKSSPWLDMPSPGAGTTPKIVIQSPVRLDQTEKIVDLLQSGCSVLLNLQKSSYEVSRRLLDFVAGVAYYNENQVWKIASNTFFMLPFDAEIFPAGAAEHF